MEAELCSRMREIVSTGCRVIAANYTHIRDVEKELSDLQLQLKLTAGPKRSALELLRKKIEEQNDRVVLARAQASTARKVTHCAT